MKRKFPIGLAMAAGLLVWHNASAQDPGEGDILPDAAVPAAAVQDLEAETRLLDGIGRGITLSLAQCEMADTCDPRVRREELQALVETVEQRIDTLLARRARSGEDELEGVLVAYAQVRDEFSAQLESLGHIAPADTGPRGLDGLTEDVLERQDSSDSAGVPSELDQLFRDSDQEFFDDSDLSDDE